MRSRSVLVVLSLLALTAAPVAAAKKVKNPQAGKIAAKKVKGGKDAKLGKAARTGRGIGDTRVKPGKDKAGPVVARSAATSANRRSVPRRQIPTRTVARRPAGGTHTPHLTPAVTQAAQPAAFDSVATRRRPGRVKKWFVGMLVAVGLAAGAFGWQAADMNSKVSDAWDHVSTTISQVVDGVDGPGSGSSNGPEAPDPGEPPDPGTGDPSDPEIPSDPSEDPSQDPSQQDPSGPKGGQGNQNPKGPEVDN